MNDDFISVSDLNIVGSSFFLLYTYTWRCLVYIVSLILVQLDLLVNSVKADESSVSSSVVAKCRRL